MKKAMIIALSAIALIGYIVPTVSAKVITMNGVTYQAFKDPDSGEYTLLPIKKPTTKPKITTLPALNIPKAAELKKNALLDSENLEEVESFFAKQNKRKGYSNASGTSMNASGDSSDIPKGFSVPKGVISESPDKSEVIENTKSDAVYYEYVCSNPKGCPYDKDGKCIGCTKVKVYEEKEVVKLPAEQPKIKHSVLPVEEKFFGIPPGKYYMSEQMSIIGSKIAEMKMTRGFVAEYTEVSPGNYLVIFSGGAEYTSSNVDSVRAFSCPLPTTKFVTIDKDGKITTSKILTKGTCYEKNPEDIVSFRYYNVDQNTIKTVRVRKHKEWIVGCKDCANTLRTDITTFVRL